MTMNLQNKTKDVKSVYYFLLEPRRLVLEGMMTASMIHCALCRKAISGMGGPEWGAICQKCGEDILKTQHTTIL